jgi:pimeloyl-ACP methyl ester carboxylesterase
VGSASLYYERTGSGSPVVLLHGFATDRRLWDDQVAALSHLHTVVRYDLRGFGRSTPGTDAYSHADDLRGLLTHLEIERAAIIGLSLGGGAAINFALTHPNMVQSLVLIDPSLGGFGWSQSFTADQNAVRAAARDRGVQAARDLWLSHPLFHPAMSNPVTAQRLAAMVGDYSGWHWLNQDSGLPFRPPAITRLGEIAAPTLVAVGELDIHDFQQIASTLEAGIPDVWKVVVPGVGHIANLEAPERFNEMATAFLAETERRSRR